MYIVTIDGQFFFGTGKYDRPGYELINPPVDLAVNAAGTFTFTPCVPNMLLAACCKMRLIPYVARRLSISRPYNLDTIRRSIMLPSKNVTPNAAGIEII